MRAVTCLLAPGMLLMLPGAILAAQSEQSESASVERGRYIVEIGGCNDCHTAGYPEAGGNVPVEKWLLGSEIGFRGPWGTTYPSNLRLYMQDKTEDEWVEQAKTLETRPPMPWFNVRAMHEADLRSVYRFVKSLEPSGDPAPEYVPPGEAPEHPYIVMAPPKTPDD